MIFPSRAFPCLLALLALGAASTGRAASTGDLIFEGRIDAGTCNLATGDVDRTITLDPVKVSDFDSEPSAGRREFELTAKCESDVVNAVFTFSGTPDPDSAERFENTGTASGIGLWLKSRVDETTIAPGQSRSVAVVAGKAVLLLAAAYYKSSSTVAQGTLKSTLTVDLTYN